ncbi:MAG: Crp/Fnr family transcriptional regulator [Elusimicrobia bacterium]|nr:Crp/Fnr family transcriptional regulator [Elusimicrobiota bacterium]MDE2237319.1 Crp/Fnr family transcriptional regulator [Elusimicrobiota bacterium]MDE2426386.1 Crp/Fnr family transcriptional regulator [Elusimicrobiota bacterium]
MAFSKREAPNCDWCPHRKNCLYELLGTKESKKAWREMRLAHPFRAGEVVFHEGTMPLGVYVVCTGSVKIYKSSRTGQQLITRLESPGDLLGHITLLANDGPYMGTGEALRPSIISMVDAPTFFQFLEQYPHASRALLRELARDVRRGENKARDIAFKPARNRLADTLVRMMKPAKPRPVVSGIKRRDLAEMAGLTIETAVRLLRDFEERRLLQKKERDLVILDEPGLRALAGFSP